MQPRENMVGVNMVLAEYHQNTLKEQIANRFMITMFEFDCIMLKPCLPQPCFHVAGIIIIIIVIIIIMTIAIIMSILP